MRLTPLALFALAAVGHAQSQTTPASAPWTIPTSFGAGEAVRQAFAQRATITTNRQRLEEARRNASASGAYPATRFDLGRDLFNDADIMGSADLLVYQPLDVFGKSKGLRRQGDAALATALAAFRQGALDVQQEALTAYANLSSAQRLLELARTQREIAQSVTVSTQKRVAARDLPEIQAARAALEVERADQVVADREAAVQVARLRLAAALGVDDVPPGAQLALLDAPVDPPGDVAAARPELLTLHAEEQQAIADERVAKQALLPDVEIQAGRTSFNAPAQYGARIQLTGTLWDFGASRDRQRAAAARRAAAASAIADRTRGARKDIEAAKAEFAAAERSIAGYAKLVEGSRSLLQRTQRGFELGANTLFDVLDARRALSDAQELVVNAQLRRDLAVEGVLRAEGRFLQEPSLEVSK